MEAKKLIQISNWFGNKDYSERKALDEAFGNEGIANREEKFYEFLEDSFDKEKELEKLIDDEVPYTEYKTTVLRFILENKEKLAKLI